MASVWVAPPPWGGGVRYALATRTTRTSRLAGIVWFVEGDWCQVGQPVCATWTHGLGRLDWGFDTERILFDGRRLFGEKLGSSQGTIVAKSEESSPGLEHQQI